MKIIERRKEKKRWKRTHEIKTPIKWKERYFIASVFVCVFVHTADKEGEFGQRKISYMQIFWENHSHS